MYLTHTHNFTFSIHLLSISLSSILPDSLSSIHIQLVGPYHELAGLLPVSSQSILHYRYYYDPPELITVLARDETSEKNVTGYHIGYYRFDTCM